MTRIMIVDDVAQNLYMLQTLLAGNGYDVVTARNGKEALDSARQGPPDLIISDILMPVMDGFTLCRLWKQDTRLAHIPFVVYTATYTEPADERFALSLGADLFIVKPVETDVFLSHIKDALSRYGEQGVRGTPVEPTSETSYLRDYNEVLIRKLEDKLSQLENANRDLAIKDFAIESSISGIVMADLSGILTYVNTSFSAMWGYARPELYGKRLEDLVNDPSVLRFITRGFREKSGWLGEVEAKRKDGSTFIALLAAHSIMDRADSPVGLMISCIDVTERKRMQEELQRNQKLESLNLFARGVAHDFNNLLTGLFGNIQLAKRELPAASPAGKYLDDVIGVFERARDLAQRLLTYAKGRQPNVGEVRVDEILRECCTLSLSGSSIRNEFDLVDDLWTVWAEANQLSRVFNNIIINARQSMKGGGNLRVSARNRNLDHDRVGQLPAGRYVEISIKDEGAGIPDDAVPRIFDPFFTTKAGGTGLGLATSNAIVKNHGGYIGVVSAPGAGSTFTVWLPACFEKRASLRPKSALDSVRGEGRILVMDDEKVIRDLARKMLKLGGYDVVTVASGRDAIDAYKQASSSGSAFAAVILDLTVPGGMGGTETASELLKADPHATIIISSGYSDDASVSRLKELGFIPLIPKPYLMHELLATVKAAISRRSLQVAPGGETSRP